jgi:hypothetical protein
MIAISHSLQSMSDAPSRQFGDQSDGHAWKRGGVCRPPFAHSIASPSPPEPIPLVILSPQAKDLLPQQWFKTATIVIRRLTQHQNASILTAAGVDHGSHEEILRLTAQDDEGCIVRFRTFQSSDL